MNNQIFLLILLLLNGAVTRNINSHFIEKNIMKSKNENNLFHYEDLCAYYSDVPTKADVKKDEKEKEKEPKTFRKCLEINCSDEVYDCDSECLETLSTCRVADSYEKGEYSDCIKEDQKARFLVCCIKHYCNDYYYYPQ